MESSLWTQTTPTSLFCYGHAEPSTVATQTFVTLSEESEQIFRHFRMTIPDIFAQLRLQNLQNQSVIELTSKDGYIRRSLYCVGFALVGIASIIACLALEVFSLGFFSGLVLVGLGLMCLFFGYNVFCTDQEELAVSGAESLSISHEQEGAIRGFLDAHYHELSEHLHVEISSLEQIQKQPFPYLTDEEKMLVLTLPCYIHALNELNGLYWTYITKSELD